jgi:hypothetical protein
VQKGKGQKNERGLLEQKREGLDKNFEKDFRKRKKKL